MAVCYVSTGLTYFRLVIHLCGLLQVKSEVPSVVDSSDDVSTTTLALSPTVTTTEMNDDELLSLPCREVNHRLQSLSVCLMHMLGYSSIVAKFFTV